MSAVGGCSPSYRGILPRMNRERAKWELSELAAHIKTTIADIDAGRYDDSGDLAYEVGLDHLMDHLVWAWHFSKMTDEEIDALTPEQFRRITRAIPKLNVAHRRVEVWENPLEER